MSTSPRPAPPRRLGPHGLACLTVACVASCVVGLLHGSGTGTTPSFVLWLASALTFAVTLVAIQRVLAVPAKGKPYARTLAAGIVAGPIGGVLVFAVDALAAERRFDAAFVAVLGSFLGVLIGAAIAVASLPITLAARDWKTNTLDGFDRALNVDALVLLAIGAVTTAVQCQGGDRGWEGVVVLGLGALALVWAGARALVRRRWLAAVVANEAPGFRLAEAKPEDALLPPLVRAGGAADAVLVHENAAPAGPFRSGPALASRVARVDPARALARLAVRAPLCFAVAACVLAVQVPLARRRARATAHTWEHTPLTPTAVNGLDGATNVAIGALYGCARVEDGTLRCWGNGAGPILGQDYPSTRSAEARPDIGAFEALAAGARHLCVIRTIGASRTLCWGDNRQGELGDDGGLERTPPIEVGPPNVMKLAIGEHFTLALTRDGKVHRWGHAPTGDFRWGIVEQKDVEPALVTGLENIVDVVAGAEHACAIDRAGIVFCFGQNTWGQADGKRSIAPVPVRVSPTRIDTLPGVTERLALGAEASWARVRMPDGRVVWWGWGRNVLWGPNVRLSPNEDTMTGPQEIAGTETFQDIRPSFRHACALGYDGAVTCWGSGTNGQLGDGDLTVIDAPPRLVLPPGSALDLVGRRDYTCARGAKTLRCWGSL